MLPNRLRLFGFFGGSMMNLACRHVVGSFKEMAAQRLSNKNKKTRGTTRLQRRKGSMEQLAGRRTSCTIREPSLSVSKSTLHTLHQA